MAYPHAVTTVKRTCRPVLSGLTSSSLHVKTFGNPCEDTNRWMENPFPVKVARMFDLVSTDGMKTFSTLPNVAERRLSSNNPTAVTLNKFWADRLTNWILHGCPSRTTYPSFVPFFVMDDDLPPEERNSCPTPIRTPKFRISESDLHIWEGTYFVKSSRL